MCFGKVGVWVWALDTTLITSRFGDGLSFMHDESLVDDGSCSERAG